MRVSGFTLTGPQSLYGPQFTCILFLSVLGFTVSFFYNFFFGFLCQKLFKNALLSHFCSLHINIMKYIYKNQKKVVPDSGFIFNNKALQNTHETSMILKREGRTYKSM